MSGKAAQEKRQKGPDHQEAADRELAGLLEKHALIQAEGFRIDLASAHEQWDRCLKRLGPERAYARMAETLCRAYRERFGEEYLLTEACVAWEIRYHADAYMAVKGYRQYSRHVTTLLFPKPYLEEHCREIDISTEDMSSWKQRTMFRYRQGIREQYRGTEKDPFRR